MPSVVIESSTQTPKRKPKKQPAREKDPLVRAAERFAKSGRISEKQLAKLQGKKASA
jgi:hypothetical protein